MVTQKFRARVNAFRQIFRSNQFIVFSVKNGKPDAVAYGEDDLAEVMQMAIQMKKSYNQMVKMIEAAAEQQDELQTLMQMRQALEAVDDAGH